MKIQKIISLIFFLTLFSFLAHPVHAKTPPACPSGWAPYDFPPMSTYCGGFTSAASYYCLYHGSTAPSTSNICVGNKLGEFGFSCGNAGMGGNEQCELVCCDYQCLDSNFKPLRQGTNCGYQVAGLNTGGVCNGQGACEVASSNKALKPIALGGQHLTTGEKAGQAIPVTAAPVGALVGTPAAPAPAQITVAAPLVVAAPIAPTAPQITAATPLVVAAPLAPATPQITAATPLVVGAPVAPAPAQITAAPVTTPIVGYPAATNLVAAQQVRTTTAAPPPPTALINAALGGLASVTAKVTAITGIAPVSTDMKAPAAPAPANTFTVQPLTLSYKPPGPAVAQDSPNGSPIAPLLRCSQGYVEIKLDDWAIAGLKERYPSLLVEDAWGCKVKDDIIYHHKAGNPAPCPPLVLAGDNPPDTFYSSSPFYYECLSAYKLYENDKPHLKPEYQNEHPAADSCLNEFQINGFQILEDSPYSFGCLLKGKESTFNRDHPYWDPAACKEGTWKGESGEYGEGEQPGFQLCAVFVPLPVTPSIPIDSR